MRFYSRALNAAAGGYSASSDIGPFVASGSGQGSGPGALVLGMDGTGGEAYQSVGNTEK